MTRAADYNPTVPAPAHSDVSVHALAFYRDEISMVRLMLECDDNECLAIGRSLLEAGVQ